MTTDHRRLVRAAEHGEAGNVGRYANQPEPDYLDAAKLAVEQPGVAILVREWGLPGPTARVEGGNTDRSDERRIADETAEVRRHVGNERQAQDRLLTRLDQSGGHLAPWADCNQQGVPATADPPERFQVSMVTVPIGTSDSYGAPKSVVRTVIVFHPGGRPKATRASRAADTMTDAEVADAKAAEAEHAASPVADATVAEPEPVEAPPRPERSTDGA